MAWIFIYTAACLAAAAMLSTLRDDNGIIRLTNGLLRTVPGCDRGRGVGQSRYLIDPGAP